jgi:alkylhydroperoxidase/carboxymuconolactone decarboxylase family protein YurZ
MNPSDIDREAIQAEFVRERGYWRPWTDTFLRERPEFLRQYARYAGYPARTGPMSERMVELIYVALDASASHLFESGLRTHMGKAMQCGATPADIFDVLHLVATQGLASVVQAAAILAQETNPSLVTEGAWDPMALLERLDPGYAEVVQALLDFDGPDHGLVPAEKCLVHIALNACFTAHNPPALRHHIRQGLSLGLTTGQMLQAIQLGAHLSVHGTALGAQVYESLR